MSDSVSPPLAVVAGNEPDLGGDAAVSDDDVEIYLHDLGLDDSDIGRSFGSADEPPVDESPLLPSGPRFPPQALTHEQSTESAPSTTSTGSTTPTVPILSEESIITSTPPKSTTKHKPTLPGFRVSARDLLSPVTDIDSPRLPPATRMAPIPLPLYDDDPTLSLPTSLEQLDLGTGPTRPNIPSFALPDDGRKPGHVRKSPTEKLRMRPLSLKSAGATASYGALPPLATPPPSSPLPALPHGAYPSTAPPTLSYFPGSMLSDPTASPSASYTTPPNTSASSVGSGLNSSRPGSIPGTPSLQSNSSYTQSQPLPQLPTFAPALTAINERSISKDDSDLSLNIDRRVIKKEPSPPLPTSQNLAYDRDYDEPNPFSSNRGGDHSFDGDSQRDHAKPSQRSSFLAQSLPNVQHGPQPQQQLASATNAHHHHRQMSALSAGTSSVSSGSNDGNNNLTSGSTHQQYGAITVSNSAVSFPNSEGISTGVAPSVTSALAQDFSLMSVSTGQRAGILPGQQPLVVVANGMVGSASPQGYQQYSQHSLGRQFDANKSSDEQQSQEGSVSDSGKTPNVYINGLPPHFPEDQLYALTAPFGEVKSVRTFTRHVRDSESGYGFVLFETVDAAERCIASLRRYRNLHPTFSKQVHKIPGTVYAQVKSTQGSATSDGSSAQGFDEDGDASFKARMEALADPLSTNLYMEGLPLSIDEPTLSALVAPHRIVSSRFFQTRLSNPPRIIAFVRLDTRIGAEEVIEKLHGRMVRGVNDTGSRISVRFADTAEQRELRRQERTVQEGNAPADPGSARLSIAQAALLNLRGQDLRNDGPASASTSLPPPPPSAIKNPTTAYPVIGQRGMEWPSNSDIAVSTQGHDANNYVVGHNSAFVPSGMVAGVGVGGGAPRTVRLGNGAPDLEYASAFSGGLAGSSNQSRYALPDGGDGAFQVDYGASPARGLDGQHHRYRSSVSSMESAMLMAPLSSNASLNATVDQREIYRQHLEQQLQHEYRNQLQQHQTGQYGHGGSGVASTRTGYTAAEEYIMRTHAERQGQFGGAGLDQQRKQKPAPLDLARQGGMEMGLRALRTAPGAIGVGMSDEDMFHAHAGSMFGQRGANATRASVDLGQYQASPLSPIDVQHGHNAHLRSSTLPLQHQNQSSLTGPTSAGLSSSTRGHYTRNSMSMSMSGTAPMRTAQHALAIVQQQESAQRHVRRGSAGGESSLIGSGNLTNGNGNGMGANRLSSSLLSAAVRSNSHQRSSAGGAGQEAFDSSDNMSLSPSSSSHSPSMISPALTYSSQAVTPSTLSPATPFFGSFNSQNEGFKALDAAHGAGGGAKQENLAGIVGQGHGVKRAGAQL